MKGEERGEGRGRQKEERGKEVGGCSVSQGILLIGSWKGVPIL